MPRPGASRNNGKAHNTKRAWKDFLKSIKRFRAAIIIAMILSVTAAGLGVFIPKLLGDMTNIAVNTYPEIDFGEILTKVAIVVGLFVGSALLNYIQGYILAVVAAKYTQDLRNKIIDKIARLPISYQACLHICTATRAHLKTIRSCRICSKSLKQARFHSFCWIV